MSFCSNLFCWNYSNVKFCGTCASEKLHIARVRGKIKFDRRISSPQHKKEKYEPIKKNKIQCKLCQDIIESTRTHNFQFCKCGSCAFDGGHDYLKRVGHPSLFLELSE